MGDERSGLSSSGHKTGQLLPVLLTGVCLVASSSYAVESSTANSVQKPVSHSSAGSTHATTVHPAAKKPGTPTATSHSAFTQKVTPHSGAAHSRARKATPHASSAYAANRTPGHSTAYASQHKGSTQRRWQPRTLTGYQRLARVHLQPERTQEIQQALIREGYLQGEANGQWDSRTHDAMLRYQTDHGFSPTGLPEAKSLMKLGLGSHPLPPDLDHGPVGAASPGPAQGGFIATPPAPPVSQVTPPS